MNLFVVGWDLSTELIRVAERELSRMTRTYPLLDPATFRSKGDGETGRTFVASMHSPTSAIGPRCYACWNDDAVTLYDGLPVDAKSDVSGHDARELGANWERLPDILEGQFAVVRITHSPESMSVLTDPLGMKQVFHTTTGKGCLVSNSAALLAKIVNDIAIDPLGASTFLTWGWVSDDHTLHRDVRRITGGQQWTWDSLGNTPAQRCYYEPSRLAGLPREKLSDDRIRQTTDAMARAVAAIAGTMGAARCGLTAGRDSRLLAALCKHYSIPIDFVTYAAPESKEAVLATEVARILGLNHAVHTAAKGAVVDEWETISRAFVEQNDGLVSLWQVPIMLGRPAELKQLGMNLGGHAGEIGRGFYLEPQFLLEPGTRKAEGLILRQLVGPSYGLIKPNAVAKASSYIRDFDTRMREIGFRPNDVPDAFYMYERVGCWAGSVVRPNYPVQDVFCPLAMRAFVDTVFTMNSWSRYFEEFHYGAIRVLTPELAHLPTGKQSGPYQRLLRDALRGVARMDPFGVIERRRGASSMQAGWLGGLRQHFRDFCLDHTESDLWELVDRQAFDRLTSTNSTAHVELLLRIVTLFSHDVWTRSGDRRVT